MTFIPLLAPLFSAGAAGAAGTAAAAGAGASTLSTIGTVAGLAGAGLSAAGTIAGGIGANNAAKAQAEQLDMKAAEARAVAQREALEERRQGAVLQSNMIAAAAAGGGSTSDPGIMDMLLDSNDVSLQNERLARYQGEVSARNSTFGADQARLQGKQARLGGFLGGGAQLFSGLSGIAGYAQKYGQYG